MGPYSPSSKADEHRSSDILGIWRMGEVIHRTATSEISAAQPADSAGNPRWDYVVKSAVDAQKNPESRRQVDQSVAVASEVAHPNLVPLLDGAVTGVSPYLVMPRLGGVTLGAHFSESPEVALPVALWFVRQIAQACEALHAAGWIHGDIKPDNVIVGPRGHVTLIDLGFAARVHAPLGKLFRGTPQYASPELIDGSVAALPAMDVFSLGRILWQALVKTESAGSAQQAPVAELIEVMVSDDPAKRPDAAAVVKGLLRLEIETLGRHIGPERGRRLAA